MIGIDLGTTNSAVAIMEGKTPKIIENAEGQFSMYNQAHPRFIASLLTLLRQVHGQHHQLLPLLRMASVLSVLLPSAKPLSTLRTPFSPRSD